ncbi:MAG: PIG-L family deacetylase [Ignavibacteriales bacterium]|nr:PIG-L family deacetylase [Ignavibacteriales bacterium]
MNSNEIALIVAHPDDETLWAGGTILMHPNWRRFIVSLCRSSDIERANRFFNALKILKAEGIMGDLDDGPEQNALDEKEVENLIKKLLIKKHFDLIISHNPNGEYTRHKRHEETGRAVINLWYNGEILTRELWAFAYEDGNKQYYPRPQANADLFQNLKEKIWKTKYRIITETYGFEINSWEAVTTPKAEAFWKFTNPNDAKKWLDNRGVLI